jgi:hypothetical protein
VLSTLAAAMMLLSVWRTIYWHWLSLDANSNLETHAAYHRQTWLVYLCISAVWTFIFSLLLFFSMKRRKQSDENAT